MLKTYSSDEDRVKRLHPLIPTLTLEAAQTEVCSRTPTGACVIVDISKGRVVYRHRMDMLLHLSDANLKDLHDLILNDFYRLQVKAYCHAAGEILGTEGYAHLGKKGVKFVQVFPGKVQGRNYLDRKENSLILQQSEPFILEYPDSAHSFAVIDTYQIIAVHRGDYFPIAPMFMKDGLLLENETKIMVKNAIRYIYSRLPFKKRHLDILEILSKGKKSQDIAAILHIAESTVEAYRRDIRSVVKRIFPDLNEVKMAMKLREMGVFE